MNHKKKLMAAAAGHVLGLSPSVKFRGNSDQVSSFSLALRESKRLYEALNDETRSCEIPEILEAKTIAAQEFKKSFGYPWPF